MKKIIFIVSTLIVFFAIVFVFFSKDTSIEKKTVPEIRKKNVLSAEKRANQNSEKDVSTNDGEEEGNTTQPSNASQMKASERNQEKTLEPRDKTNDVFSLFGDWEKSDRVERQNIMTRMLEQREQSILVMRIVLQEGSQNEKLFACKFLSEARDKESEDTIINKVNDPDGKVQVRAILSLRTIGSVKTVNAIRQKITETTETAVLKSCLATLGELGSIEDILVCSQYLTHEDESVRVNAAAALAMLGSDVGQEVLFHATQSSNPQANREATYALGFLDTQESSQRLNEIVNQQEGWTVEARMALANQMVRNLPSNEDKAQALYRFILDSNRLLSEWAIDQLIDVDSPHAVDLLREYADSHRENSAYADHLLILTGKEEKNE